MGRQILDDIERLKLQFSQLIEVVLGGAELIRRANGKFLRKLHHCFEFFDDAIEDGFNEDSERLDAFNDSM